MPGWLSRLLGLSGPTRRRARGHGDAGGVAPFVATPIGLSDAGREESDSGGDPPATGDSIGSDTGPDGGGSCGASCGAV